MKLAGHEGIYAVAEEFATRCLGEGGSLFEPDRQLWGGPALHEVYARFVEKPDVSSDSFFGKFERQLAGADDAVYLLAGELLYIHLLVASDITGKKKREIVRRPLSWAARPSDIPTLLDQALESGLSGTGIAFNRYRPFQLWLILELAKVMQSGSVTDRQGLLTDPWEFKRVLFSLPVKSAYTQREALLHLVHPDTFEAIVSRDHKAAISAAFAEYVDSHVSDVDQRLATIRQQLAGELDVAPSDFNFYTDGIVQRWKTTKVGNQEAQPEEGSQRAWLVRGVFKGENLVRRWVEDGYVAIGWDELGDVPVGLSRDELTARMQEAYPDAPMGRIRNSVGNVDRFLNQMSSGDLVVSPGTDGVYVGVAASAPYWIPTEEGGRARSRRSVEWANVDAPIPRSALTPSAYSKMRTLLTVTDLTEDLQSLAALAGITLGSVPAVAAEQQPLELPTGTSQLADDLLLEQAWIDEAIELLYEKRQLVFYGPPGTGKTFLAQRLAQHLTSMGGTYDLVQFHPSYAYEDFFEGFRPRQAADNSGAVGFELVPGPMRRLADAARDDPGNPYVLIIDELNRANLAKVFGELYFLLEYRDEAITLQYSPDEDFQLPKNVFVVGTMNTADRSIALVDAAMRRRFYFLGFFPQEPPIAGLLERWLERNTLPAESAALLDELNTRIGDPDFAVGPSYLMTRRVGTPGGLERIWQHAILPLLEEHYIGSGRDVAGEFGLAALRAALTGSSGPQAGADPATR